jgi:hypothetical protein
MDNRCAIGIACDFIISAGLAFCAGMRGAFAQPFVEILAIHHADKAAINRHIHGFRAGGDHASRIDLGDQ